MRNLIIITLLVSTSSIAADKLAENKLGASSSTTIDAAALYEKHCSICHGEKADKAPLSKMVPIAGMDATRLARMIREYRDQDKDIGAYTINKNSQVMKEATSSLSDPQIGAIAKYISSLK